MTIALYDTFAYRHIIRWYPIIPVLSHFSTNINLRAAVLNLELLADPAEGHEREPGLLLGPVRLHHEARAAEERHPRHRRLVVRRLRDQPHVNARHGSRDSALQIHDPANFERYLVSLSMDHQLQTLSLTSCPSRRSWRR